MTDPILTSDDIALALAEREPYSEPDELSPTGKLLRRGVGRKRYYEPWPRIRNAAKIEEEYSWLSKERESARRDSIQLRPPKTRPGGFHGSSLPGEVGPCTRCGWVWYPSRRSLLKSDFPHRCSNCRSPDWQRPPKLPGAATPASPKWLAKRAGMMERRRQRHARRLAELAEEFGKRLIDAGPMQPTGTHPGQDRLLGPQLGPVLRPMGHVIPPPPSFEEGNE